MNALRFAIIALRTARLLPAFAQNAPSEVKVAVPLSASCRREWRCWIDFGARISIHGEFQDDNIRQDMSYKVIGLRSVRCGFLQVRGRVVEMLNRELSHLFLPLPWVLQPRQPVPCPPGAFTLRLKPQLEKHTP